MKELGIREGREEEIKKMKGRKTKGRNWKEKRDEGKNEGM